jgi:hypothetical protein
VNTIREFGATIKIEELQNMTKVKRMKKVHNENKKTVNKII